MVRLRRPRSIPHLVRRVLATLLAVAALVLAVRPPGDPATAATGPPTVPVVVAGVDLGPGAVLAAGDLVVAQWPAALAPDGVARSPDDLTGRALAGPLRAGEPVTDVRMVGPGLTALLDHGEQAVPVRLADLAVAASLRAGDRVDVLATTEGADVADVVASAALVLVAPSGADDGAVWLAATPATAARLAGAMTRSTITVSLVGP
jgi:Flp pilus assembly protein CpaB